MLARPGSVLDVIRVSDGIKLEVVLKLVRSDRDVPVRQKFDLHLSYRVFPGLFHKKKTI
jgi:hypothetical protein